ncbi:MAG TPA: hypothetical protein DCY88_25645 [Cyanobacteria bacterium UBA11372]|nr:hypothetical protein [Cyanobacteria bacterium UBA11372]HBE48758.1 hypothetical protein [Cyanobacteria bacterium UBA11369]
MANNHLHNAGKNLQNENLSKFKLDYTGADFSGADLRGADLTGLTLRDANFNRTKLEGAKFNNADLKGANFSRASVDPDSSSKGVDFSNTKIQGADFSKTVLFNANFTQTCAGLDRWWCLFVIVFSLAACMLSGFTSAVFTTFILHYFFLAPHQTLPIPNQKPSLPTSLIIGLWSVVLIVSIRTILNNLFTPNAVVWHVFLAMALILIVLLFAALVMDEAKSNISSLIWIALVVLSPLVLLLATEAFTYAETWLANHPLFSFLADHVVKGLGGKAAIGKSSSWIFAKGSVIEPTNGKWISGMYGAGLGAFFGCWFSQLAIAGDERFDWLWRTYVKFTSIIKSTTFNQADLTGAIFDSATLQGVSFKHAKIARISWHDAKCMDCACVGVNSYLKYRKIRQLLVRKEWEGESFDGLDLKGINLEKAKLDGASFVGTDLSQANLRAATLTKANLKKASLEGADLTQAILTGACIQAWVTDETTVLDNVICDYVFLKDAPDPITCAKERLPDAAADNNSFEPGDFETFFKKDGKTIQLLVRNSDNRQALRGAFEQLMQNRNYEFQGLEIRGDKALVKIRIDQNTNKVRAINKFYQKLKELEQQNQNSSNLPEDIAQPLFQFILNLVGDIYNVGQAGAVGQNARYDNNREQE